MMKRRNYLICSIIAMLSIVSYACETEYATCNGCFDSSGEDQGGGTKKCAGGTLSNGQGTQFSLKERRCSKDLKGIELCEDDDCCIKSESDKILCFNNNKENKPNHDVIETACTPNSYYDRSKDQVCHNGELKELGPIEFDTTANEIIKNSKDPKALWEIAVKGNGKTSYYNCHNKPALDRIGRDSNNNDKKNTCCTEGDRFVKHTGYKYYSVEKCVKVEGKDFNAYKYDTDWNDVLIGKKDTLPYSFLYKNRMWIAENDNRLKDEFSIYREYTCGDDAKIDNNNGLCLDVAVEVLKAQKLKCQKSNIQTHTTYIIKNSDNTIVAECPEGTVLKIVSDDKLQDCGENDEFELDKVRCEPAQQK